MRALLAAMAIIVGLIAAVDWVWLSHEPNHSPINTESGKIESALNRSAEAIQPTVKRFSADRPFEPKGDAAERRDYRRSQ